MLLELFWFTYQSQVWVSVWLKCSIPSPCLMSGLIILFILLSSLFSDLSSYAVKMLKSGPAGGGGRIREWAAQCFPHPSAGTWGQFALGHQTRNTDRQCDHQPRCSTPSSPPPWGGTWTTTRRCTTCRCSRTSSQTSSQTSTVSEGGGRGTNCINVDCIFK